MIVILGSPSMSVAPHCVTPSASVAPHHVTPNMSVAPHPVTATESVAPHSKLLLVWTHLHGWSAMMWSHWQGWSDMMWSHWHGWRSKYYEGFRCFSLFEAKLRQKWIFDHCLADQEEKPFNICKDHIPWQGLFNTTWNPNNFGTSDASQI